jgi:hypothetical protein
MALEPRSKERIYSDILAAGCQAGFVVVPEFSLRYQPVRGRKQTDVAWIADAEDRGVYRVVAAFEVEGFDVPLTTIDSHVRLYSRIQKTEGIEFPCYIPLYSRAIHRPNYGRSLDRVQRCLSKRSASAAKHRDVVQVCDGSVREWLVQATAKAKHLAAALTQTAAQ